MNKTEKLILEGIWFLMKEENLGEEHDKNVERKKELVKEIEEALNPTKETLPYKKALEIGSSSQKKRKVGE